MIALDSACLLTLPVPVLLDLQVGVTVLAHHRAPWARMGGYSRLITQGQIR